MLAANIPNVAAIIYSYLLLMGESGVLVQRPKCLTGTFTRRTKTILQCNFDNQLCPSLELVKHADFDWSIGNGPTPSENTGPSRDHTTGKGSYIFIDSGKADILNRYFARFQTKWMRASFRKHICLTFWYHMKGLTTGTLSVYLQEGKEGKETLQFRRSGEQESFWQRARIPFKGPRKPFRIIFQATTSFGHTSDIAVDDITVVKSHLRCCRWPPNQIEREKPKDLKPLIHQRPENPLSCGRRRINIKKSNSKAFIIEGKESFPGEWPWMAMLTKLNYDVDSFSPFCGGTLLGDRWIITAAHCVVDMETRDEVRIRLGVTDIMDNSKTKQSPVDATVKEVFIHPDYNWKKMWNNDVALIKLATPVKFNKFVNSVCLPSADVKFEAGKTCHVTGWGRMGNGDANQPNILRKGKVYLQSDDKCYNVYRNRLTLSMVCAGNDNGVITDTCDGDSGGPLMYQDTNGQWVLAGITSWGTPNLCGAAGKYGVYTNVLSKAIRNWVVKVTACEPDDNRIKFRAPSDIKYRGKC